MVIVGICLNIPIQPRIAKYMTDKETLLRIEAKILGFELLDGECCALCKGYAVKDYIRPAEALLVYRKEGAVLLCKECTELQKRNFLSVEEYGFRYTLITV